MGHDLVVADRRFYNLIANLMEQKQKESTEKNWIEIAENLDLLQKDKNDGGGMTCVRDIIAFLKMGDIKNAKGIAMWDHDKIRNHPDIEEFLEKNIFENDPDSPVKRRKRLAETFGWNK